MGGVFDLQKGAFDSSEAQKLFKAYSIALQGLRASHAVDSTVAHKLARSIVKVARTEPDCLNNEGMIEPGRLAQRAILRMLQINAPTAERAGAPEKTATDDRWTRAVAPEKAVPATDSTARIMQRLFDRTVFAKL